MSDDLTKKYSDPAHHVFIETSPRSEAIILAFPREANESTKGLLAHRSSHPVHPRLDAPVEPSQASRFVGTTTKGVTLIRDGKSLDLS